MAYVCACAILRACCELLSRAFFASFHLCLPCHSEHARPGVLSSAQYLHQPWEHGDHPPDLSDEDDVFLANLKAQTAK